MRGNAPSSDASSMSRSRASWAILGLAAATIVVGGAVAAGGFDDDDGTVHKPSIDALAVAGITAGCATDLVRYCLNGLVSRGQMATFLARVASWYGGL